MKYLVFGLVLASNVVILPAAASAHGDRIADIKAAVEKTVPTVVRAKAAAVLTQFPELIMQLGFDEPVNGRCPQSLPTLQEAQQLADSFSIASPDLVQDFRLMGLSALWAAVKCQRLVSVSLFLIWNSLDPSVEAMDARLAYVETHACVSNPKK
jgi:hypothetical protein